ncbi:hypothetical protein GYH30_034937 [Glycine max]|uniref:Replication factor A C-terminal domain-containing protein n=1 Tax=Glycine max TaxID=3847 RepID=A0A0R0GRC2_SOYBN|nr:hypothetical protein GYH30_034937 [Glycine max]
MARIADKIKNIDGSKETLKFVFFGDQIHVVCKQDQLKTWKMDLKEDCTYMMHNFRVSMNDGQFRVCDHPYKLTFIGVMVVRQCELDELPFKNYRFADFSDVIAGQLQSDLLVDIIGVVDEVVFRHISPRSKRVVFKLMNLSNQLLSCTLWDDYYLQFLEYLDQHETERPIIVMLTNARIKEGQGSYPCSISNSLKASKLTINEAVAPIEDFNQKLSELGIEIHSVLTRRSQWSSQASGSAQLSSRETFISKSEAKTISEINNLCEEFVYVTVGTITRIFMDNHSWCYAACIQCHKKTNVYTEPFVCPCGKHNDRAVLRYRVEVMINYKDESTKFLLWDRECTEFIGQSADEVNTLKVEQSISITTNHDPLIELPLTPTKRQPFHECDDEARSSQISPAQLSSNKLAKHDQIE